MLSTIIHIHIQTKITIYIKRNEIENDWCLALDNVMQDKHMDAILQFSGTCVCEPLRRHTLLRPIHTTCKRFVLPKFVRETKAADLFPFVVFIASCYHSFLNYYFSLF